MSSVFPGVEEVMASLGRRVSMLMRLDLPTFDRPMKAYSGCPSWGQRAGLVLLTTNSAVRISMIFGCLFKGFTLKFRLQKYKKPSEIRKFAVIIQSSKEKNDANNPIISFTAT